MIGLDTGFFIELMNSRQEAVNLWKSALEDEVDLVVSALTLFEIERLGLKGKLRDWEAVVHAIENVTIVATLERETMSLGARLSHGLGMPAIDSLILASLISHAVDEIWTTDSHFEAYHSKNVAIKNLQSTL